jgi:hypothetical protein
MMKGITIANVPTLIYTAMLIVAFVGAAYIMAESFQGTTYAATTVTNETINFATNNTDYSFANPYVSSVSSVKNVTYTVPTDRWSISTTGYHVVQVRILTNATFTTGNYNVTYIYNKESKSSAAIGYVIAFMDAIINNLPVVGIITFIALLVGAVMWIRAGQKKQGGA